MYYIDFLAAAHHRLQPATYLEIGVRDGRSLALARARAVAIDPAYAVKAELDCHLSLFRTTSDEYFSRPDPLVVTAGRPFELAFIDGLHLFEFALRDFVNAERYSSPRGMILFDDMLPRSVDEAARSKHTRAWTGDVYSMVQVLEHYRPDLTVLTIDVRPTGLLLVAGLDPQNTALTDNYNEIIATYRHADPQPVPAELLDRLSVLDPNRVLGTRMWQILRDAAPGATPEQVRGELADDLGAVLGPAWGRLRNGGVTVRS